MPLFSHRLNTGAKGPRHDVGAADPPGPRPANEALLPNRVPAPAPGVVSVARGRGARAPRPPWQATLWHRTDTAQGAERELRAAVADSQPTHFSAQVVAMARPSLHIDHYILNADDQRYWVKMRRVGPCHGPWPERHLAAQASLMRFAPRVLPAPGARHSIVMDDLSGQALSSARAQTPEARLAVLTLLRSLHTAFNPQRAAAMPLGAKAWEAWQGRLFVPHRRHGTQLLPAALAAHMQKLAQAVQSQVVQLRLCHNDPRPCHLFWRQGPAQLISWGAAQDGDPLRDVAQFFATTHLDVGEVDGLLTLYLLRAPEPRERHHFLTLLQGLHLDDYARLQQTRNAAAWEISARALQIVQFAAALGVPASASLWAPAAASELVAQSHCARAAHLAAQDVVGMAYALTPVSRGRGRRPHTAYRLEGAGRTLHLALVSMDRAQAPTKPRAFAAAAAAMGLSPRLHDTPHAPHALVTDWVEGRALGADEVVSPAMRRGVAILLARLHRGGAPLLDGVDAEPVGSWWRLPAWAALMSAGQTSRRIWAAPIALPAVAAHMGAVQAALGLLASPRAPCHGRVTRQNLLVYDGQLLLLGWGHADWGDPMGDLARLFGHRPLNLADIADTLAHYLQKPARPAQLRHFTLALQAFCIEQVAHLLQSDVDRDTELRAACAQMRRLAQALPELPALPFAPAGALTP